jgi:hypothetical protein
VLATDRLGASPRFANGHSGGVCAPSFGFDEPDVSALDAAYGEAFISYHVPAYGLAGSGTVPRYWKVDSATNPCFPARFSNIWFQNLEPGTPTSCPDDQDLTGCIENNQWHLLGAGESADGSNGETLSPNNMSYVYTYNIGVTCEGVTGGCPADTLGKLYRNAASHELSHQFGTNRCTVSTDPPIFHHDQRNAWCSSGGTCANPLYLFEWCPMHVLTGPTDAQTDRDMRADGIDQFCREDLILGDPNCATAGDGAMRREEDPQ